MQLVSLADVEFAYLSQGVGHPIVLLHGFPLDHTMWNAQIEALAKSNQVIAPDLRGFGESSLGDADVSRGVMMEEYADDMAALLEAIGVREPIVLAGFSMGGYIAWQFVRKYGDRLRGLIQVDTRAAADTDEARKNRLKMAEKVQEWGSARVADLMGPNLFAPGRFESNTEIVQELRRVVSSTSPDAIACAQRGMAARPDMTSYLPSIRVPALVIAGRDDKLIPAAEMEQIAGVIPQGQYVEIAGAGHMAPMENPEAVNKAMGDFVSDLN